MQEQMLFHIRASDGMYTVYKGVREIYKGTQRSMHTGMSCFFWELYLDFKKVKALLYKNKLNKGENNAKEEEGLTGGWNLRMEVVF